MAFFAVKNFRNKTEVVSLYQSSKKICNSAHQSITHFTRYDNKICC